MQQAERFARCLRANGRFTDVQVRESGQAKHPERRYYTYWTPRNVARAKELLQEAQSAREARSFSQAGRYEFHLSDCGRYHFTLNLLSGEVYQTTVYTCDCPDAECNLRFSGLLCKHSLMLERHLEAAAEEAETDRQLEEQAARQAWEHADREACDAARRELIERARAKMANDYPAED